MPTSFVDDAVGALIVRFTHASEAASERNARRRDSTRAAGEAVAYGTLAVDLLPKQYGATSDALRDLARNLRAEAESDEQRATKAKTNAARWRGYARVWREGAEALDGIARLADDAAHAASERASIR